MAEGSKSVFVLGATGYIGGAVLVAYKKAFPSWNFTALVRNPAVKPKFDQIGVNILQGDHSQHALITEAAKNADIVLNAADADDLPLTQAILDGLKQRHEATKASGGPKPILIHTSGTGVASVPANGEAPTSSTPRYDDGKVESIKSIPESAPHRLIDLTIFDANKQGYVNAYIIAPATIYGLGDGPVRTISQQVPNLIIKAIDTGSAVRIGKGHNEWPNVQIDDLSDLYVLVLKRALDSSVQDEDSFAKFYWGTSATHVWGEVVQKISEILVEKKLISSTEIKEIPTSSALGSTGTNSITIATRGKSIGWNPKHLDVTSTIPEEIDAIVQGNRPSPL